MARSLRIPAVVGLKDVSGQLESGQYALLDGLNGVLIVNPTDQTLFEYGQLILRQVTLQQRLRDLLTRAGRHAGRASRLAQRQHRASRRRRTGQSQRRGGRGPVPHRIPVPEPRASAGRRAAIPGLPRSRRRPQAAAGRHPHARFGRRQVPGAHADADRDESLPGLARDSDLLAGARHLPRAAPRHSARQRRGQRQDDVPDDLGPGRIEAGQCAARGIQGRAARRRRFPSTKTWRSGR